MGNLLEVFGALLAVLLLLAFIVLVPFGLIWALNTLGITSAGYTFYTWFASIVLILLLGSGVEG